MCFCSLYINYNIDQIHLVGITCNTFVFMEIIFSVVAVPRQCIFTPAEVADHSLEEIRLNSTLALKKELQLLQVTAV